MRDYSDFIDGIILYVFAHRNSNKVWKYQPFSNYFDRNRLIDYSRYGYSIFCDLNVYDNKYTIDEMWRLIGEEEEQEEEQVKEYSNIDSHSEDSDSADEDEYEYENYGTQPDGSYLVFGGGMMNGNAYASYYWKKIW